MSRTTHKSTGGRSNVGSYPAPDLSADGYFAFEFAYIPPREWPGVRLSVTFLVTLA